MSNEYQLPYTGSEIEEKLKKIDELNIQNAINGTNSLEYTHQEDFCITNPNASDNMYKYLEQGSPYVYSDTAVYLSFNFNDDFTIGQQYTLSSGSRFQFTDGQIRYTDRDYIFTYTGNNKAWTMTTANRGYQSTPIIFILDSSGMTAQKFIVRTDLPITTTCKDFLATDNGCSLKESSSNVGWIGMTLDKQKIYARSNSAGDCSISLTNSGLALGTNSFVTGYGNIAMGNDSFVTGINNIAERNYSCVVGMNNKVETNALFTVGNGITGRSSNAFTVDVFGDAKVASSLKAQSVYADGVKLEPITHKSVHCYLTDGSLTLTPDKAYLITGDKISLKITHSEDGEVLNIASTTGIMCICGRIGDTNDKVAYGKFLYVDKTSLVSTITSRCQPIYGDMNGSDNKYTAVVSWTGAADVTEL